MGMHHALDIRARHVDSAMNDEARGVNFLVWIPEDVAVQIDFHEV